MASCDDDDESDNDMHNNNDDDQARPLLPRDPPCPPRPIDTKLDHTVPTIRRWLKRAAVLVIIALMVWASFRTLARRSTTPTDHLPARIFQHLGQYSPYFPVAAYVQPPSHCHIDQVSILQRHGARYPTSGAAKAIRQTLRKLQRQSAIGDDPQLAFLKSYKYDLGEEELVPLGLHEARQAAEQAFGRYGHLAQSKGVFVRTSSSPRVQRSAQEWSKAFESASQASSDPLNIHPPLVLSDVLGSNDTLANNGCPNHMPLRMHWDWASIFTIPIRDRLQAKLGRGLELSSHDIIVLFDLCSFNSVAKQATSPFCTIFEEEEILDFEYFQDLEKYYNRGYGHPLGPVQGIGFVNELIARLTGTPVSDETQTNTTLDRDPSTFPLDKGIYADFSHDNTMAAIVSAIGLFRDNQKLPIDHRSRNHIWRFGHIAPFAGRIVFERLNCNGIASLRILANDAIQPLGFCGADRDGVSTLEDFVESQGFARQNGQGTWQQCGWRPADEYQAEHTAQHDAIGNL